MKLSVYTVTYNDDYATPFCEVYLSERDAVEAVADHLDIYGEDREEMLASYSSGLGRYEELLEKHKNEDDSFVIQYHELEVPLEVGPSTRDSATD